MERVSEPTVKSEMEDSIWANTEYEGKETHSIQNPPEKLMYIKDSLYSKDEPEEISDCIKKEIKDEVEVGFEEWGESETGERDCLLGCVEGNLTEVGQIPSPWTGMPEVFQKIKVETQGSDEFNNMALEAGLDAAEGKPVKPEEEEWCQVESSHTSSVGLKLEHTNQENVMLDPMAESLPQGPEIVEDPGSHLSNKDDSLELKASSSKRNSFGQLSAKAFGGSNFSQCSPVNSKESQCTYNPCLRVTSNTDDLNISSVTQNKGRKFECSQCSYKTNCKRYFTKHCRNHSNAKKFACDKCSFKTNYRSNFTQHCLNHSNLKKFACDQCSYKTNYRNDFTKHSLNHSNIKKFACDKCSYKTNYGSDFTRHCLNHSNIKKFACDHCSYKTNQKSHFTQHCTTHSNIKQFSCDHCSYKTNHKSSLTVHCLNHTNIKKFVCDRCSYKTNDRRHFTRHYGNHSSIKRFVCDQCSYKTNDKGQFTRHCLNHSSVKKFACDQCSYKTNDKRYFTRHCMTHSSMKKFACDLCSYKTNNKSHFTRHCMDYSHKKEFACYQCSYKTIYRNNFTEHCLNHSSIK